MSCKGEAEEQARALAPVTRIAPAQVDGAGHGPPAAAPSASSDVPVQSFDEFCVARGVPSSPPSDESLHRGSHHVSGVQQKRAWARADRDGREWAARRAALYQEWQHLAARGQVREPTYEERLIRTAQGHEDNESTQAARRVLAKRGITWNC